MSKKADCAPMVQRVHTAVSQIFSAVEKKAIGAAVRGGAEEWAFSGSKHRSGCGGPGTDPHRMRIG
jgi:hypothetical protein